MAETPVDIREQIAKALDSQGYESVESLVSECILQTRTVSQLVRCIHCNREFTVGVKQPAPDKRAKALAELANQAKGAPGRAAEKDKPPSMADKLTDMSTEQLEKLARG